MVEYLYWDSELHNELLFSDLQPRNWSKKMNTNVLTIIIHKNSKETLG